MADARVHEPKLAALHAYAQGRLRPAARARFERHLARCLVCREAQIGLARYTQLLAAAHAQQTPAVDWARVHPAIENEAQRFARAQRVRRIAPAAAALAIAAGVALIVARSTPEPVAPQPTRAPPPVASTTPPLPAALVASITALAGTASALDADGHSVALTLESRPTQGWTIETGADGEVHMVLPNTAALIVPARSRLELRTLRDGDVELALSQGHVVSHVHKLDSGERYDVLAADRRIAVRGTHFDVERDANRLAVQIDEGVVQVLAGDGSLVTELRAPQRWSEEDARNGSAQRVTARLHRPLEKTPTSDAWPVLRLPAWPHVVAWELADADFGSASELAMRLPAGRIEIVAQLDDGRRVRGEITLDAVGARFDPRQLHWPRESAGETAPSRPTDASAASAVIRSAQPALQRCYERSMRSQASGAPSLLKVKLRVDIDARGHVRRAELLGAEAATGSLGECVQQVASRWQFPAPGGGGLSFEAPLTFHPLH